MLTLPRFLRVVGPSLFAFFWFAHATVGQTETATVSGLVTDRTAAAVSGAEVRLQSVERGTITTTTTNDAGIYVFPSVQPGPYQISIQKQGFKQVDLVGLIVNVQDHIEQNFRLEVGSVTESVTVEAAASMINTTGGSVSTVVDQTYVKNMPLNGRSFQDLILLTPGIVTQSPQPVVVGGLGRTGEFSVNGQRTDSNYYTVDGVSANLGGTTGQDMFGRSGASGSLAASTALGTTQALVSADALQEFRVQSSSYSAEYGRNPGGQFAFETKSGANQFHGTAYDYLRNDFFDANDWFNNYFGAKGTALRQNDFGGTLGGPVKIPHVYSGKDKTFFFVSYEGLRLTSPVPASINFVPDSALRSSAPASLQPVLNAFPVQSPNGVDDTTNGIAQFIGNWSNPSSIDSTSVRLDHAISDKLRFFFRFSETSSNTASRGSSSISTSPTMNRTDSSTLRTYTVGATNMVTPSLSNDFRLNYSSNDLSSRIVIDALGGSTPVDLVKLAGVSAVTEPDVALFIGSYGLQLFPLVNRAAQKQWNLVDAVSASLGRHQVKFGVDYRRLAPFAGNVPIALYFYFSKNAVISNSAFGLFNSSNPLYPLYKNFSAFAQDEWKVSQRLNLSLGLRWDVNPAPGVTQGLRPYTIEGTGPNNWDLAPQGTPLWKTTWYDFGPRLGAAYVLHKAPGRETVVRVGAGVFFDTGQQRGSQGYMGPGFAASASGSSPFPGVPVFPPVVNPPVRKYSQRVAGFAAHLQLPYTLQWNASIEQALGRSQALTFSYVGSHASRLLKQDIFPAPTNPNATTGFLFISNGLTSDYDSLQIQFQRRLSRGLTTLASYTWSHCLDYGSFNLDFGYQRGNCDFDVRHNLSAAFSYDLPNVGLNPFTKAVLSHWGLDDRFTARTAFPVTLRGNTIVDTVTGEQFAAGLNLVPGQPIYLYGANCASVLQSLGKLAPGKGCPGGRAINPSAFVNVTSGIGNAPRNFATGFGAWQMDLAVRREFPIQENLKLQFRAEAFNVFNHPNFGSISTTGNTFGQATATLATSLGVLSPLYQAGGPRSMQFALRLIF